MPWALLPLHRGHQHLNCHWMFTLIPSQRTPLGCRPRLCVFVCVCVHDSLGPQHSLSALSPVEWQRRVCSPQTTVIHCVPGDRPVKEWTRTSGHSGLNHLDASRKDVTVIFNIDTFQIRNHVTALQVVKWTLFSCGRIWEICRRELSLLYF